MAYGTMSATEIKETRDSLGMTQAEFAELLGVSQMAVSHWENAIRRPSGSAQILIQMLKKQGPKKKTRILAK